MIKKNQVFLLLLIGLVFRILISFYNYSGDVTTLMIWGEDAVKHGLPGLYERNFEKIYGHISPNYPPLSILFYSLLYLVKGWIYQFAWFLNLHIPSFPSGIIPFLEAFNYYPYLIKIPAILSDIGIAYITYLFTDKIIGKSKSSWLIISVSLILFNPAYFYNSAVWGQNDSLPLFFLLGSFYLLLFKKNYPASAVLFTLGLLSKQTIVIFLPLYLLVTIKKTKLKQSLISILITLIIFLIFFIPFYQKGNFITFPVLTYIYKIILSPGIPYTSNHAFNFWYLLTDSRQVLASSKFIFNISYEIWGYLSTTIISVSVLVKLVKNRVQLNDILYAGFLIPLTSFLFLTKMHERHLILALPFLLLLTYKNKFLLFSFLFISIFNFLNMYHDWWSPNLHPLMEILSSTLITKSLTVILIIFFVINLSNYLKIRSKKIN